MTSNVKAKIEEIIKKENLSIKQLIDKYPHLAEIYMSSTLDKDELVEDTKKEKKLLLD